MFTTDEARPPRQEHYPQFVGRDDESRYRWDLCIAVASQALEEPPTRGTVVMAARVLYHDQTLPT